MADISELKGQVLSRFQELTDDEVGILETLGDSPVGAIILKLLGPELNEIFSDDAPTDETEQMLAEDEMPVDDMPQAMERDRPQDVPQDMRRDMPVDEAQRNTMPQGLDREPPMLMDDPQRDREMASR